MRLVVAVVDVVDTVAKIVGVADGRLDLQRRYFVRACFGKKKKKKKMMMTMMMTRKTAIFLRSVVGREGSDLRRLLNERT